MDSKVPTHSRFYSMWPSPVGSPLKHCQGCGEKRKRRDTGLGWVKALCFHAIKMTVKIALTSTPWGKDQ
jgi:hypothetical protein